MQTVWKNITTCQGKVPDEDFSCILHVRTQEAARTYMQARADVCVDTGLLKQSESDIFHYLLQCSGIMVHIISGSFPRLFQVSLI